MSENVTFVAGKAVEQTTNGESNTPTDEREAAMAAVREALKAEGEKAAKEAKESVEKDPYRVRDESGKFKPTGSDPEALHEKEKAQAVKAAEKATKQVEKEEAKDAKSDKDKENEADIRRVLRERKQLAEAKSRHQDELRQQQEAIRQQYAQLQQMQAEIAQERQRLQRLTKDPGAAIRELGYDPEEYILDLAQEGTPEGKMRRQQREMERQLKEMADWKAEMARQAEQQRHQYEAQKAKAYRQYVEQEFLRVAEKEAPLAHSFFKNGKEQMMIALGDVIAEQYKALAGRDATFEDIARYLESEFGDWYNSRGSQQSQQSSGSAPSFSGSSTPGSVTGKTLNPGLSSERRTLGTKLSDLDGDERLAAAREAVGAALRASGEHR